jgi:hypothetical protein
VSGKETGQGGAVGAGALHAPGDGFAEPAGPGEQVLIAGGRGGDAAGADAAAELVAGMGDVNVEVGVDTDRDPGRGGACQADDGRLLSFAGQGWHARRPGGQHCDGSATGSYQVTFVRLPCRWWPRLKPTGRLQGTKPLGGGVRLSLRPPAR